MMVGRRAHSAGARLHRQLFVQFSVIAVAPAVLVAVFSAITLEYGHRGLVQSASAEASSPRSKSPMPMSRP